MNQRPTRVRYVVLAFAWMLSMVTYLDRVCFGQVAPLLAGELSVPNLKWAFTAFTLAYAIFEIPSGWLGDAWGPRSALLRIVIWWSACTALTGLVGLNFASFTFGGLATLVTLRFLFGMGEAGAYPNIARVLHNWFPTDQSAIAQGWVWMSGRLMGGLTPLIWTLLVAGTAWTAPLVSWRWAFALFGLIGVLWCAAFAAFFRDHPRNHQLVNDAERIRIEHGRETGEASHTSVPVRDFLRSGNLWRLCLMYFCMNYGWYFNITYLPSYLQERFQTDPHSILGAIFQGGPLLLGAISCLLGGFLVDWLIRRTGNRRRTRQYVGMAAESLCALGWLAAIFAPNANWFFLAISLAAMFNDLTLPNAWATCQDIGQRYTAVTAACMNTIGTLGAVTANLLTGTIGYNRSFITFAVAYLISALCWRYIDCNKPIIDTPQPATTT